jgi:GDPmannose 4,6-dehydratase
MWMMLQQDQPDEYVVATGVGVTVRDFCSAAFQYLDLDYSDYVISEDRYNRPTEVDALIGDANKIKDNLGWTAKTNWRELAKLMVAADLASISKSQ